MPSEDRRPPAIALMGPTASGKSALALEWARRLGGEIISVDSALVYRRLDIGSAKPDADEQAQARHHLLDLRDPHQPYSAADFCRDARRAIDDILARGRLPLLVGGTGLYFRALTEGLSPLPEADTALRAAIAGEAQVRGWLALHADLAAVDPDAGRRIRPSDPQRIQRALEVWRLTGRPISQWQREGTRAARLPVRLLKLALWPDRTLLRRRIGLRFDAMLAAGFLDEVRRLRADPRLHTDLPAIRAVGYRQAWEHLEGQVDQAEFRRRAVVATGKLAKRQLTWLRGEIDVRRFDPDVPDGRAALERAIQAFLPT